MFLQELFTQSDSIDQYELVCFLQSILHHVKSKFIQYDTYAGPGYKYIIPRIFASSYIWAFCD